MYLCICNAITDREARPHATSSGCSVAAFYRTLGVKPQCGKCAPAMRQLLDSAPSASVDSRQDFSSVER
jgi:bacterioferritin-associated ferredoxin